MASLMDILKKAGFRGSALNMAYAIAMAESGGRAGAHNGDISTGDNSYGLFQINMLGAMGPERRKRYGLKSNDDLFDPLVNARVAYKMSNGGRNWQPWSTYKNGAYKRYYGQSGASVSGSGSASGGVVPVLDDDELAASYGLSRALINSDKELKSLFKKAVSGGWSASRFQASLKNTKWWKNQPSSLRQYITQKYEDPATFKQKREAAGAVVKSLAVQVGVDPKLLLKDGDWAKLLSDLVYKKVALGWTDARLKDYLGNSVVLHDGQMWGEAGETFDKLHTLAYTNGVTWSDDTFRKYTREIVAGRSTIENTEAKIRQQAAAKYTGFAEQIKAGQNALDLAAPYINSVAQILELPETDVDLNNKYVAKAMTSVNGGTFPIWQLENEVRADPLWKKTNNARESMFSVAHSVAKDFGLVF
jgi:hypothetical protein